MKDKTMDNQQATDIKLIYLAGLMDGEGCFTINLIRARKSTPRYKATIQFTNTDVNLVNFFIDFCKKRNLVTYTRVRTGNKRRRDCYDVKITSLKSMKTFCEMIIPHLIGKKSEAEIVLKFINSRMKRTKEYMKTRNNRGQFEGGFSSYTDEDISLHQAIGSLRDYTLNTKKVKI